MGKNTIINTSSYFNNFANERYKLRLPVGRWSSSTPPLQAYLTKGKAQTDSVPATLADYRNQGDKQ